MAKLLKGLPVAKALMEGLEPRVGALRAAGITPTLAVVRVGERPDDLSYERGILKRCEAAGVEVRRFLLRQDCAQDELMEAIHAINADDGIHGCLMFRPLPRTLDEEAACEALDPRKDMDGMTRAALFGVFANQPVGYAPCTAQAVVELLDHYGYDVSGKDVVVVGRSLVIGKPVSMLLQARNATVTMCHTRTRDLAAHCARADVVVVAAGHPATIGAQAVAAHHVVVDVGINWDDVAGKLVGDVAFDEVEPIVSAVTPVPGGVGSITTAVLAAHVVDAAERSQAAAAAAPAPGRDRA